MQSIATLVQSGRKSLQSASNGSVIVFAPNSLLQLSLRIDRCLGCLFSVFHNFLLSASARMKNVE